MKLQLLACLSMTVLTFGQLEAADVEKIVFTNVTNIAAAQGGVFKANLENGAAIVAAQFDAKGKDYLEAAQRRIQKSAKSVARKVEDYNRQPEVVVKKGTEYYNEGGVMGWKPVVTDVQAKGPLVLPKAPDFIVYGRKQADGSLLLVGTTEIASPSGSKRYTW